MRERLKMKKYIITSLLFFIPFMSMAADHCTNPSEYTIDKRCYVTDTQKQQRPYNAVVGITRPEPVSILSFIKYTNCTGTIARWDYGHGPARNGPQDSGLYLFTAKHCTDNDNDGQPDKTLHIKLQNGDKYDATLVAVGDYNINDDSNFSGDWAIYRLPGDPFQESTDPYIANVHKNMRQYTGGTETWNGIPWIYADSDAITRDGRPISLIGYGCLTIMSDNEIAKLRQNYIKRLEQAGITDMSYENTGLTDDGGIDLSKKAAAVVKSMFEERQVFHDNQLKVSKCFFRNRNNLCQGWSGNSGDPLIDNSDRLVGILTRGGNSIGGADHAQSAGYISEDFDKYTNSAGGDGDIPVGRVYQSMGK